MRYWLHRISHHQEASRPLLEKGFLTIGFSDFSKLHDFLSKEESDFNAEFLNQWGPPVRRSRLNLWRFLHEMKKDDFVLVPGYGTFSLYVIEDDPEPIGNLPISDLNTWTGESIENREGLLYSKHKPIDLGFFIRVKLHRIENGAEAKDIPRYEYADAALTARMKIRQANAEITDLEDNIRKSLDHFRDQQPLNLHSRIMEETTQKILDLIRTDLDPDKFESLVGWYFNRVGASKVDRPLKNEPDKEGDADIIATFEPIKSIVYAQVKFHREGSKTNEWAVEQIQKYVDYKKTNEQEDDGYSKVLWVVSTCDDFTEDCQKSAKEEGVTLIHGREFTRMLIHAGIEKLGTAI